MPRASFRLVVPLVAALACGAANAALSIYLPPEELAAAAPLVLEGTVARVASAYDPVTGSVATYVTIDMRAVHRGPADLSRVVLRELGGRYGELVNEVDAVPAYRVGEHVLVFAEPARDGALRTAGLFFGKFTIGAEEGPARARREMSGRGTILRAPPDIAEELPVADLLALVAAGPAPERARAPGAIGWRAVPLEFDRLVWEPGASVEPDGTRMTAAEFTSLSSLHPARWEEADSSVAIPVDVERARNPLGDGVAAVAAIARATAAWTDVPEARIALHGGNDDAAFTRTNARSPAAALALTNIVLFGDPYDDLPDPIGCAGTLALGGYWRTTGTGRTVNGTEFHRIRRLYVVFNRNFECFLADPKNLAEIAAHELGHGIGLGHSSAPDSILRSFAYGDRGAVLGRDDRDAVHCVYPHTLSLIAPDGGERWAAGTIRSIAWRASVESGPDPGTVDLDYSVDDGASWTPIALAEPNDGSFSWVVPNTLGYRTRVRIGRRALAGPLPAPYPALCSQDVSGSSFTISAGTGPVGSVPDGSGGPPLRVERTTEGALSFGWGATCGRADDYAIYEGTLATLRAGGWDHRPLSCATGPGLASTALPGEGGRYYLVAPRAGGVEGTFGRSSSGALRPPSATSCGLRESSTCP